MRLHYVEVREPDMHDPSGDLRRLFEALEREWKLTRLGCDYAVLGELQACLRKGGWKVTVAVHDESQVIAVWPGFHDRAYGMAVDVGSTTVAAHLCNLETGELAAAAGTMNPQIRFGEDLMSRVSYAMMNPGRGAADDGGDPRRPVGPRRRARARAPASRPPTSSSSRSSATRSCITWCSASTRWNSAARRLRSPWTSR